MQIGRIKVEEVRQQMSKSLADEGGLRSMDSTFSAPRPVIPLNMMKSAANFYSKPNESFMKKLK